MIILVDYTRSHALCHVMNMHILNEHNYEECSKNTRDVGCLQPNVWMQKSSNQIPADQVSYKKALKGVQSSANASSGSPLFYCFSFQLVNYQ